MYSKRLWKEAKRSLTWMLICLTILAIAAQIAFFAIHAKISSLIDSLVNSAVGDSIFYPVVWVPLLQFFLLQILAYGLIIVWIRFVAFAVAEMAGWLPRTGYQFGLIFWCTTCIAILTLNHAWYPHSFFAAWINELPNGALISKICLILSSAILTISSILAGWHLLKSSRKLSYISLAIVFVAITMLVISKPNTHIPQAKTNQPNVIIIGLDSVRPDFIGAKKHTPSINRFLKSAEIYTNAYTPLARTFPSWVSILTAKYPIHSHGVSNLANPDPVVKNDMLSKRLQKAGYTTIYATDEVRFSNISEQFGFDKVVHPHPGLLDFILGGMTDFPLTNLLVSMPGGKWLFPYNYANRAAYITYYPQHFMTQLQSALIARDKGKPLFFAVHFCLSHWPYTWANDGETTEYQPQLYKNALEKIDKELAELMQMLKREGLLSNTLVVLLSDHGTTLGLPGDRLIEKADYTGKKEKLNLLEVSRFSSASEGSLNLEKDYSINTSYGQGTDVLSLKQYHVLLAFRGFGFSVPTKQIAKISSLIDVAPTILDYLNLPPMNNIDGLSLKSAAFYKTNRPLFIESAATINGLDTDKIDTAKIVANEITAYKVDRKVGTLILTSQAMMGMAQNKQHAIIFNDKILAHYPVSYYNKLATNKKSGKVDFHTAQKPAYYVLFDLRTGKWTVGSDGELQQRLNRFYSH